MNVATQPQPNRSLVVSGCDVLNIPPVGECTVTGPHDIQILDGLITGVGPVGSLTIDGVEIIDGTKLLAMPGLINAHTHSPMVLMRGAAEDVSVESWFNDRVWPMESNLTSDDIALGARLACAEMLTSGVTTFADHYFDPTQIARAAVETGIRANIAPTYFSSNGRPALAATAQFTAEWHGAANGRITASMGPHSTYTVSDDDLIEVARLAVEQQIRVHIHAAEHLEQTESSLSRRGITPIQQLEQTGILDAGVLIAHGCGIIDQDLPILARYAETAAVACCPKVYLKHALFPLTPVRKLREVGVTVGVGTDGAAGHNTLDIFEAMRLVALTQKQAERDALWMSLSETLRMATRGGAAAVGLDGQVGAIEVGMRADIILVDLSGLHCRPLHDPRAALVYSSRATDVRTVIVDGSVVKDETGLRTIDTAELLDNLEPLTARLLDVSHGRAVQHYDP